MKETQIEKKKVTFYLDTKAVEDLKVEAKKEGRSASNMLNTILKQRYNLTK